MVTIKHKSCRKLLVPFSQLTRIPRRIAKMSGDEIRVRLSQHLAARWDSRFHSWRPGLTASTQLSGEIRPIVFFSPEERRAIVDYIRRRHPEIVQDVTQSASEICEH